MNLVMKDMWIRHGHVDIGRGDDRLVFERCTFVGGTVNVDPGVDGKIFVDCLFQGTRFTAQSLCPRIAAGSHWQAPSTEDACQAQAPPESGLDRGYHAVRSIPASLTMLGPCGSGETPHGDT
jgi:hypothetical protein